MRTRLALLGGLMMLALGCRDGKHERTGQRSDAKIDSREHEGAVLTDDDKQYLLKLARRTVTDCLSDRSAPAIDKKSVPVNARKKLGCFVTLHGKNKSLRGCIGTYTRPGGPELYENVMRMAAESTRDGRFRSNPVTSAELKDIEIEISVLTEPKPLAFDSPEDLLAKLRPKVDGVILRTRYGRSTYLPQVWEQLPEKEGFLSRLCGKHGAPGNEWKRNWQDLSVQTYQAIVFHEE